MTSAATVLRPQDLGEVQAAHEVPEPLQREPQVQQGGDGHVAADPREGIEDQTAQFNL